MRFQVLSEPLHCFATKQHRCIILDIRLPCMSGFGLDRHLASIGPPIAGGICFGARWARCATGGSTRKGDLILSKAVRRLRCSRLSTPRLGHEEKNVVRLRALRPHSSDAMSPNILIQCPLCAVSKAATVAVAATCWKINMPTTSGIEENHLEVSEFPRKPYSVDRG